MNRIFNLTKFIKIKLLAKLIKIKINLLGNKKRNKMFTIKMINHIKTTQSQEKKQKKLVRNLKKIKKLIMIVKQKLIKMKNIILIENLQEMVKGILNQYILINSKLHRMKNNKLINKWNNIFYWFLYSFRRTYKPQMIYLLITSSTHLNFLLYPINRSQFLSTYFKFHPNRFRFSVTCQLLQDLRIFGSQYLSLENSNFDHL